MIVIVTPTIMYGPVVRWYRDRTAHEIGREAANACRTGFAFPGLLGLDDDELVAAARAAHAALKADPRADLSHLATHRRVGVFGHALEPITREERP